MAREEVATALHNPSLGGLTTTPRTEFDLSVFDGLDFSKPEALWDTLTHEQRIAVARIRLAADDGTLPRETRESIRSALGNATFDNLFTATKATAPLTTTPDTELTKTARSDVDTLLPETKTNGKQRKRLKSVLRPPPSTGTGPLTKSVSWDDAKSDTYKGRSNMDGSTDRQSDWKTLQENGWKSRGSRATKPRKQKKIDGEHWRAVKDAYETVRDGGDLWAHAPTSKLTLADFPTLYKYRERPKLGDPDVTATTLAQWDEEDLARMEAKLKPLDWITGPLRTTGNRDTAFSTMSRKEQEEWAMEVEMMTNKNMTVLCSTREARDTYLGKKKGQKDPEGMTERIKLMAEASANATQARKEKTERKVAYRNETTVPIITNDKLYARTLDRALDDLEALRRTEASTDASIRRKGRTAYRARLRSRKNLTRDERDGLYEDLSAADDMATLVKDQGGADRTTVQRFADSIQKMRQNGQSEVRPTVLFDYDAFYKWRAAKEEAKWTIGYLTNDTSGGSGDDGSTAGSDTSDSDGTTSSEDSEDDDDSSEEEE